jgi:HK97 family phage portal protein
MSPMSLVETDLSEAPIERAVEGEPRPGPWVIQYGSTPGLLPDAWGYWNHWQMDLDPLGFPSSPMVEACVAAYANTIALCPGDHWRTLDNGGRERVRTSALSRLLIEPNDYQSRSDFLLNLVRQLYLHGNVYALAERNNRFEVSALHLFDANQSHHAIAPDGTIYYRLAGNHVVEPRMRNSASELLRAGIVPARDVFHVKLDTQPYDPLEGLSPLRNCAAAVAVQSALSQQLLQFFANQSRPSGVIETDMTLTSAQVTELRKAWEAQARGMNAGGVPILTSGLKFHGISSTARDAEMPALMQITADQICQVMGVPPAILGITDRSTFASTEALMQFWLARGLGFTLNHVEVAFDQFFGLAGYPQEYVEFDVGALLRPAHKDRIDGLVKGVQGGIYAPNEARRVEGYPDAKDGDEPRVQQQVVPLSAWSKPPPKTPAPEAPPAAAAIAEEPEPEAEEEELSLDELAAVHRHRFTQAIREAERARAA